MVAVVLAYGWWVTGLRPFSGSALLAVEGAGLLAVAAGLLAASARRRRRRTPTGAPALTGSGGSVTAPAGPGGEAAPETPVAWLPGLEVWVVLVVLLAGWELAAYFQHPRSEHPTLSLLMEGVLAPRPVRAAAFAGWLAGTYRLARPR